MNSTTCLLSILKEEAHPQWRRGPAVGNVMKAKPWIWRRLAKNWTWAIRLFFTNLVNSKRQKLSREVWESIILRRPGNTGKLWQWMRWSGHRSKIETFQLQCSYQATWNKDIKLITQELFFLGTWELWAIHSLKAVVNITKMLLNRPEKVMSINSFRSSVKKMLNFTI